MIGFLLRARKGKNKEKENSTESFVLAWGGRQGFETAPTGRTDLSFVFLGMYQYYHTFHVQERKGERRGERKKEREAKICSMRF